MKMQMWIYRLNNNEEQAFCIQEQDETKYHRNGTSTKTGKKVYTIWHDQYEGGYAYDSDWNFVDGDGYPNVPESGEWKSYDDAYKWIIDNYGNVTEIEY